MLSTPHGALGTPSGGGALPKEEDKDFQLHTVH